MMKILTLVLIFIIGLAYKGIAFDNMISGMMMDNMDNLIDQQEDRNLQKMTDEQKITAIQAHIIESMFLKTLLEDDPILQMNKEEREEENASEDEDSGLVSMASDYSFNNKIMSKELSKKLAQKDLLRMTQQFKNRRQAINIDVSKPIGNYE